MRRILLAFCCMRCILLAACGQISGLEFSTKPAASLAVPAVTLTSEKVRSDVECAVRCRQVRTCRSAKFEADAGVCHLQSQPEMGGLMPECLGEVLVRDGRTFCVVQQRTSATVDFNRNWSDYVTGFGDANNFWAGLHNIHLMSVTPRLFRAEMGTWDSKTFVCEYAAFSVADASTKYAMTVSGFLTGSSNTSGDSMVPHTGMKFTTFDSDNDLYASNCASYYGGGWWFGACYNSNPNGPYKSAGETHGVDWYNAENKHTTMKWMRLMLLLPA